MRETFVVVAILALLVCLVTPSNKAHADKLWEHTIHDGRDPYSVPKTKISCAKWAKIPGAKVCIGHKVQCKYIQSKVSIWIEGLPQTESKSKVEQCGDNAFKTGLLFALPQLILTSGTSGGDTFLRTAGADLARCVSNVGTNVKLRYGSDSYRDREWTRC